MDWYAFDEKKDNGNGLDEYILGGGEKEERRKERKICSMRDRSNNFK